MIVAFKAQGGVVLTSLHSFGVITNGEYPKAGLALGSDGNFYGTTAEGGTNGGNGTVFEINGITWAFSSLYSFTGDNGAKPYAGLVQGSDGDFYGTTDEGGTSNLGTVFKFSVGGDLITLHSFTGANDGANPYAGLVQGSDGDFYGTTEAGGTSNLGTVFQISASGVLTNLHSFIGSDGANPYGGLVQNTSDGYFYGTTEQGGTSNMGTVFNISTNGVLTSLYSFTGGVDGANPYAGMVQDPFSGIFYGTTYQGGKFNTGTVFDITPAGDLNTLYSFSGGINFDDGGYPTAGLVEDTNGDFWGTTENGGTDNNGTLFAWYPDGFHAGYLGTLYSFTGGDDGGFPIGGLVQPSGGGSFFGTTQNFGQGGVGTVFLWDGPNYIVDTLYSFTVSHDGGLPYAGLVEDTNGNFYGTTWEGGLYNSGSAFAISTNGDLTNLYSFTGGWDGAILYAGLVQGSDGNFYGTTEYGGTTNDLGIAYGTVFSISASGAFSSLYSFTNGDDGAFPCAGLVQGSDGYFYGTTVNGGINGLGAVFKISAGGDLISLHSFAGVDGADPFAALVQGSDGYFYGTTVVGGTDFGTNGGNGTVFKISSSGVLTSLYSFTGGNDGGYPYAGLVQGGDGYYYGTTEVGGTNNLGAVFKISASGALTSLYSFTGSHDGASPYAGLVQGSDGNFYGTTFAGGTNGGNGTVFEISASGVFTSLYAFTRGHDGANPYAGLVQGGDGNFYGTTEHGGAGGSGVVFELSGVPSGVPQMPLNILVADGNFGVRSNRFGFDYTGPVGPAIVIQAIADLASPTWIPLATNTLTTGTAYFSDPQWTNFPPRFYRLQMH